VLHTQLGDAESARKCLSTLERVNPAEARKLRQYLDTH
jgi:hypothetical protein